MLEQIGKLNGICYGPYRDGQSPFTRIYPTKAQIEPDLELIKGALKEKGWIRTYSTHIPMMDIVPEWVNKSGLNLLPSCWLDKNKWAASKKIEKICEVANAGLAKKVIIGDMAISNGFLTYSQLVGYIKLAGSKTKKLLGTANHWQEWLKYPELVDEVDFLSVGIYPYEAGVAAERSIDFIVDVVEKIRGIAKGKEIFIDAGWPSAGNKKKQAVCSLKNQKIFIDKFTEYCEAEGINYFLFEAFDETWKKAQDKSEASGHYGVFSAGRKPKFQMD